MPILLSTLPPNIRKQVMEKYGIKATKERKWKSGIRVDLGIFFRSSWEANIGRYLEFLKRHGQIAAWEYEPHRFFFDGIKRGTNSYLPDFKVWKTKCEYEWWEVKGWKKQRGMTALKRMAKYYPSENIVVIDSKRYHEIARQVGAMIPGWE